MKKLIGFLCVIIFFTSCSESRSEIRKKYDRIKSEIKANFHNHEEVFDWLNRYVNFDHILELEFDTNGKINLKYQHPGTGEIREIINSDIDSIELSEVLMLENTSIDNLMLLKNYLSRINVTRLRKMDVFDNISGDTFKQIDLLFSKKMTGLQFHYRIYETSLDSAENSFFTILIMNGNTGERLADKIIWYYN